LTFKLSNSEILKPVLRPRIKSALSRRANAPEKLVVTTVAQFIGVCRRSKWSKHVTNFPLLALLAMAGSNAA
jgi:hypothetical protein